MIEANSTDPPSDLNAGPIMHELSLAEALIKLVEDEQRKSDWSRAHIVRVEIGELAAVEPDAMRFCFDAVTHGTVAEGAALDIVAIAGRGWCADCAKTVTVHERPAACPECGSVRVEVTSGDQMRLKELEVD